MLPRLVPAALGLLLLALAGPAPAAPAETRTTGHDPAALALFESKAALAKRLGATHVPLTDGLPTAQWQFQPAGDPYPAWFIQRPDFFKLFLAPRI